MEIRFSEAFTGDPVCAVMDCAGKNGIATTGGKPRGNCVRFRLLDADESDHDNVIYTLLKLDPQATIRTARAVYEGLADYEAQLKARRGE